MIKPDGIERLSRIYTQQFHEGLVQLDNFACLDNVTSKELENITIGQLYELAHMREDKLKTLVLQSIDNEGTIYLTFCGMFGGMDLDGYIHT